MKNYCVVLTGFQTSSKSQIDFLKFIEVQAHESFEKFGVSNFILLIQSLFIQQPSVLLRKKIRVC